MAMRDDNDVKVDVVSEDGGKLVVRTNGEEKTYYANPIRTMRLRAEELQVFCGSRSYGLSIAERLPTPEVYAVGKAHLDSGAISVIGEPLNISRSFRLNFRAYDLATLEQQFKETGKHVYSATVGFVRRDWEIGNEDSWFIEVGVSKQTMDTLVSALSTGAMRELTLGLNLVGIYSDDNWAPPSARSNWFLRPSQPDNTVKFPELARGEVAYLDMALAKAHLAPETEPSVDDEEDEPAVEKPELEPDLKMLALHTLNSNIQKLQGTVKTVGWAIAAVLLFLALK